MQCTPSVATLWLIPRLGRLHAAHPNIDLRIVTLDPGPGGAGAGLVDIEIATLDPAEAGPNCRELMTARSAPVCAPSLLRGGRLSRPSDLLHFDLLHVLGNRDDWHRWFRSAGLSDQKVPGGVSFDGSLMALEAAVNGDGIMLGRRPFIDPHLQSGDLALAFGERHVLTTAYYLRWPEASRNRRDVAAVMDWLVEMAAGD
jgi:LysR family glycine cleavage system transcriptional activator